MGNTQNDYISSVNLNAESNFLCLVLDVINDQSHALARGFTVYLCIER